MEGGRKRGRKEEREGEREGGRRRGRDERRQERRRGERKAGRKEGGRGDNTLANVCLVYFHKKTQSPAIPDNAGQNSTSEVR